MAQLEFNLLAISQPAILRYYYKMPSEEYKQIISRTTFILSVNKNVLEQTIHCRRHTAKPKGSYRLGSVNVHIEDDNQNAYTVVGTAM